MAAGAPNLHSGGGGMVTTGDTGSVLFVGVHDFCDSSTLTLWYMCGKYRSKKVQEVNLGDN